MTPARNPRRARGDELPNSGIGLLSALLVGQESVLVSWRKTFRLVCLLSLPPLLLIGAGGLALTLVGQTPTTTGAACGAGGSLVLGAVVKGLADRLGLRQPAVPGGSETGEERS